MVGRLNYATKCAYFDRVKHLVARQCSWVRVRHNRVSAARLVRIYVPQGFNVRLILVVVSILKGLQPITL